MFYYDAFRIINNEEYLGNAIFKIFGAPLTLPPIFTFNTCDKCRHWLIRTTCL